MNTENNRINVRVQPMKLVKLKNSNTHNFRKFKTNKLDNIDGDLSHENIYHRTEKEQNILINKYDENFKKAYKKDKGYNPRDRDTTPFYDGIITFPNKYQEKNYTREEWDFCLKEFIRIYEEETGLKIISIQEHNDETTRHYHFKTTNFIIENEKVKTGILSRTKNILSKLQDVGGEAYKDLGLVRGNSKLISKTEHKTTREFYEEEAKKLEEKLADDVLTNEELKDLISTAINPFKKLYRQVLRIKNHNQELEETQKSIDKSINNIISNFPNLSKYVKQDSTIEKLELLNLLISKVAQSKESKKADKTFIGADK